MAHHHHRPPHFGKPPPYRPEKYAVFRNAQTGLVLDASEYEVKMQHFTGFPAQLWKLDALGDGRYILINKGNGKVLDIQGGAKENAHLITYQRHGGPNQQWYLNSDSTVVNGSSNLAVDIYGGYSAPGTKVIAFKKHGNPNQQFYLQYQ